MKVALIAASLTLAFSGAQAITLDFGNGPDVPTICSGNANGIGAMTACANSTFINQAYGDVAGVVDVTYFQPTNPGFSLRWWSSDYNDLYGVLWADGGDGPASYARIELKPAGNDGIHLTHFDMGAWVRTHRHSTVDVFAIGSAVSLFHFDGDVGADANHTSFNVDIASANGLWIEYRNSAYNNGIDNITFDTNIQPGIPEPETYALMLTGLAAVAAAARRRRG